ncbi:MAG TPA: phage portal protein [bacterium]|nr:phage portal protein [bacterium]
MDRERIVRLRAARPHTVGDEGEGVQFEVTSISEHNLGMIPIIHIPNSVQRMQMVGDSDIAPLIPMLDAVNQMMSDAYWQCYNDQSILKAINIDPPDSDDVEESVVRLGGDQIHFLTENDQLRQDIVRMKPVGIPESFFKTLSLLVGQIYKTAGESHLEPLNWTGTNISGVALRLLYEPLAKKTYRKRIYWASGFKRLAKILFALANSKSVVLSESGKFMLGGPEYQLKDVETVWGPLIPGDEVEQQNIVLADLSAGLIGPEDARKKRGYE